MATTSTASALSPDYTTDSLSIRLLSLYLTYRLLLALLLLASFVAQLAPEIIGTFNPSAYFYTACAYLLATMVDVVACLLRRFHLHPAHLLFILLVDICVHTVLMNASGGLDSGIGYLMLVTVAAGSIIFTGQLAVLIAAIASIGIIIESASQLFLGTGEDSLFPAGLLGILLFITALLFQGLNRALRRAETAANREAEQAAQLQELNERIISRMLTGVVVVNGGGTIELINQSAAQLLGGNGGTPPLRQGDKLSREHMAPSSPARRSSWRSRSPLSPMTCGPAAWSRAPGIWTGGWSAPAPISPGSSASRREMPCTSSNGCAPRTGSRCASSAPTSRSRSPPTSTRSTSPTVPCTRCSKPATVS